MKAIFLGEQNPKAIIEDYLKNNQIERVFIIGDKIDLDSGVRVDHITYAQTILYKFYYPWLKDITSNCLVVWNNAMRTKNRYDLHYNCIRRYMQQADHRIIFEHFPVREKEEEFMILWDMTLNNPFLKEPYAECDFSQGEIHLGDIRFEVNETPVELDEEELAAYAAEKDRIVGEVKKDPNIVPRRLLKWTEALAAKKVGGEYDTKGTIKPVMNVTVTNTGVDAYYMGRLNDYREAVNNVCEKIQRRG